jgi:hypothetical protein
MKRIWSSLVHDSPAKRLCGTSRISAICLDEQYPGPIPEHVLVAQVTQTPVVLAHASKYTRPVRRTRSAPLKLVKTILGRIDKEGCRELADLIDSLLVLREIR